MNQIPFKPIYENKTDAKNEDTLAKFCEAKWNVKMVRQRKLAQFDYVAISGSEVKAYVEMRNHSYELNKYPTTWINLSKLLIANQMQQITKIKHIFVVQFADCIAFCDLNHFLDTDYEVNFMAESPNRRNDINDREVIAHIPKSLFKIMEQTK